MKLLPSLKIAQKLPIGVAGAALIASAVIGVGAYFIAANTVTAMTADKLVTVAAGRSRRLKIDWLPSRRICRRLPFRPTRCRLSPIWK